MNGMWWKGAESWEEKGLVDQRKCICFNSRQFSGAPFGRSDGCHQESQVSEMDCGSKENCAATKFTTEAKSTLFAVAHFTKLQILDSALGKFCAKK